ncbi:SCO1431 family membrane protein [Streptomyces sp. NPDC044780]|uniref:SCO1431 family membrane protein n=1 Tax=Streptomyces luomodiensis TaxID=3026192 RepID=A0ABY9UX44_9ACTN|nr:MULTISPECIES: SCO1431 family membrane protein [unclassified Streptomyces]WAP56571.1 SCO1431 family membrane protein [Streptomyces sp. S465]WNE97131.1 SCO1431 family membrane protein [Streptomyces sp. SCA4-21]
MTDIAARRTGPHSRTGGPSDDHDHLVEHLCGWALVVVLAMLTVQLGLF